MVAMSASITEPCLHFSMKAASSGWTWRRAGQRVLGGHGAEGDAHDGVGAGGEHPQLAVADRAGFIGESWRRQKRTPVLLPIQLACISLTRSGQPSSSSRSDSSSSA